MSRVLLMVAVVCSLIAGLSLAPIGPAAAPKTDNPTLPAVPPLMNVAIGFLNNGTNNPTGVKIYINSFYGDVGAVLTLSDPDEEDGDSFDDPVPETVERKMGHTDEESEEDSEEVKDQELSEKMERKRRHSDSDQMWMHLLDLTIPGNTERKISLTNENGAWVVKEQPINMEELV